MSLRDADGTEQRVLTRSVDFAGKRVLEIGCGEGRVTWMYADQAASALGIDTDEELIETARAETPPDLADRVRFKVVSAVELAEKDGSYDIALLSWSL
jgi:2-polyprenyl-3-methyl-5-hydroxy-6-metoxy-1,4-benzoquinol methylase